MKTFSTLLVPLILLSIIGTVVTLGAAPPLNGAPAAWVLMPRVCTVPREARPTNLTLTTSNATPHVGQTFTLTAKLSLSNGSLPGVHALELYRSVNDGEFKFFCTLTTQVDDTVSKSLTYNAPVTLKFYAIFDGSDGSADLGGSLSNIVTVTVMKTI